MGTESAKETNATSSGAATMQSFKEKLTLQIEAARGKLEELKKELSSLREEDREALRQKSQEIHKRVDEQKERGRELRADLEKWQQEKVAHTEDAIASWRQRRELKRLQSRAERAEEYAVRAVMVAALDFDEAQQALLDAVAARFDAEVAASP
jgi:hypothetical protein